MPNMIDLSIEDTINAGSHREDKERLANRVFLEHPTLTGQFMRWAAMGVCRRVLGDSKWVGSGVPSNIENCPQAALSNCPAHPRHDGRWSCHFVYGCFEVTRQGYI